DWLVEQQCDDGGWTPYREDTGKPCSTKNEDSNSTAMAVQALASVGGASDQVDAGLAWLRRQQNDDGGVGYDAGGATDTNSTALSAQALNDAGTDPTAVRTAGKSPVDALVGLQVGCSAPRADRGAFRFQAKGGKAPNTLATAAALFALSGQVLPVDQPGDGAPKALPCGGEPGESDAAPAAAAYLGKVLDDNDGAVPAQQGDGDDLGTTASTAIALSAFGATDDAKKATTALTKQADGYVKGPDGEDFPPALANLVLASVATGTDPTKVADNAVERLAATGPKAPGSPTPSTEPTDADGGAGGGQSGSGGVGGWIATGVIGAVVLVGVAALLGRREEQVDQ